MKILVGLLIVSATFHAGVFTPAFACDGRIAPAIQPTAQRVFFYRATHLSVRCAWQWGDKDTKIKITEMSLADAQQDFEQEKRQASTKEYFEDFGTWFTYSENGLLWHAIGYYKNGQKPFLKPTPKPTDS